MTAIGRWLANNIPAWGYTRAEYEEQLAAQQTMLRQTTDFLNAVREELEEKNESLTASVQYASYIQQATVPSEAELRQFVRDAFIYYQPRDIVSGDLPWVRPYDGGLLVAALDCTGHGVPGALLAMLAYSLLNQVTSQAPNLTPAEILTRLDDLVCNSLSHHAHQRTLHDGMDMALVHLRPQEGGLLFGGAHRPLFLVRQGELIEHSGGHTGIGPTYASSKIFQDVQLFSQPGDAIYLFSDGILDQFGQATGKRLLKNRFRELLLEISPLPMVDQKARIHEAFAAWKGNTPQTDDVLVIGLRL